MTWLDWWPIALIVVFALAAAWAVERQVNPKDDE